MKKSFLVLLSLAFLVLSFPPYEFWPLVFFHLVPLYFLLDEIKRIWLSFLFSFFIFSIFIALLLLGIAVYYPLALYISIVLLFGLTESFRVLLFHFFKKNEYSVVLKSFGIGLFSCVLAFLLNQLEVLFPSSIFTPLATVPFLLRANQFFGIYIFIIILEAVNYLLFEIIKGKFINKKLWKQFCAMLFIWVILNFLASIIYRSEPKEEYQQAALIQGGHPVWVYKHGERNLLGKRMADNHYFDLIKKASKKNKLIILPEVPFIQSYNQLEKRLKELQTKYKLSIISGANLIEYEKQFNAAFFMDSKKVEFYKKRQLVPFHETKGYQAGEKKLKPYKVYGLKWGIGLCLENLYSRHSKRFVDNGAEALLILAEGAGFKNTGISKLHSYYSVFRAIENKRYLIHVSQSGPSFMVHSDAKVGKKTSKFVSNILRVEFQKERTKTLYSIIPDWLIVLLWLMVYLITVFLWSKAEKKNKFFKEFKS